MSWRAGSNRGAFGSNASASGAGQANKSSGAGGRRGSIGVRAVVLPSMRTSTGESASPPISPIIPIPRPAASPSTPLSSSFKDDYAMLADHAWVDEDGEMDYSFVPFSDDQQTLSVTASVVGSSVGLSDGHATQSDVEDPVIKALRQRQREEIERKREEELAEQRRAGIAKKHPVEVAEVKPHVPEVFEDTRTKQQARLDEYKRIEEERKERRRLYEERNQSFSPVVVEAATSMSWRGTAKPVTSVLSPKPEAPAIKIAQRPVPTPAIPASTASTLAPTSHVAAHPIGQTVNTTVRERTLTVRLEIRKAPLKLKFFPSTVGELKAAIVLPEPRHKLDLTRYIGTSALKQ